MSPRETVTVVEVVQPLFFRPALGSLEYSEDSSTELKEDGCLDVKLVCGCRWV